MEDSGLGLHFKTTKKSIFHGDAIVNK